MNKRLVIEQIQAYLVEELRGISEESERGDHSRIERAGEIQRQLMMYRFFPIRDYGNDDVICPGTLVELELNTIRAFYLIVPNGGGLITHVNGRPVQVITPQSPLGEALLGHRVGERVSVMIAGKNRDYSIIGLF